MRLTSVAVQDISPRCECGELCRIDNWEGYGLSDEVVERLTADRRVGYLCMKHAECVMPLLQRMCLDRYHRDLGRAVDGWQQLRRDGVFGPLPSEKRIHAVAFEPLQQWIEAGLRGAKIIAERKQAEGD